MTSTGNQVQPNSSWRPTHEVVAEVKPCLLLTKDSLHSAVLHCPDSNWVFFVCIDQVGLSNLVQKAQMNFAKDCSTCSFVRRTGLRNMPPIETKRRSLRQLYILFTTSSSMSALTCYRRLLAYPQSTGSLTQPGASTATNPSRTAMALQKRNETLPDTNL